MTESYLLTSLQFTMFLVGLYCFDLNLKFSVRFEAFHWKTRASLCCLLALLFHLWHQSRIPYIQYVCGVIAALPGSICFLKSLRCLVYLTRLFLNLTGNYKEFSTNETVKLSSEAVFVEFYCFDIESRARCSVIVFSGFALIEKHRYLLDWRLFRFGMKCWCKRSSLLLIKFYY